MIDAFIDDIITLYTTRGSEHHGESVSQLEHAVQCAQHAEAEHADPSLIAAALLHDIGHLLHKQGENAAERGIDTLHERIGSGYLARVFPPSVTEPVLLHVSAKRYIATIEPSYQALLSPSSVRSFHLQGGVMSDAEIAAFLAETYNQQAQQVRRWDEQGKVGDAVLPTLESYRPLLRSLAG